MIGKLSLVISLIFVSACAGRRSAPPRPAEYPLLNPILAAGTAFDFSELQPFNYKIQALIEDRKRAGAAKHVSVYFRDLENGPLRGVNFEEKFTAASLLKVPLLMAALKKAEGDPAFLLRRVKFDVPYRGQSFLSVRALFPGTEYSIEEVVRALAVASDNDAFALLRGEISAAELDEVYRDFVLIISDVRSIEDSMTVREYATFFRVLYNASYLGKPMSQKALGYLAESAFRDGLIAGVPTGVVVAHKYGERYFSAENVKQLHDCGIVYHPARHYVLCVMTRGDDFEKLGGVIRDISTLVYGEVSAGERGSR